MRITEKSVPVGGALLPNVAYYHLSDCHQDHCYCHQSYCLQSTQDIYTLTLEVAALFWCAFASFLPVVLLFLASFAPSPFFPVFVAAFVPSPAPCQLLMLSLPAVSASAQQTPSLAYPFLRVYPHTPVCVLAFVTSCFCC